MSTRWSKNDTAPKSTFIHKHKIERHLEDYEIQSHVSMSIWKQAKISLLLLIIPDPYSFIYS